MLDMLASLSKIPGYDFSLESLLFKPSSKFSRDLIDIFQSGYDHIHSLGDVKLTDAFSSTLTFFEKNCVPKLQKAIHTHSGITVKEVICRDLYFKDIPSASGLFAISFETPKKKPKDPMWDMSQVVSGKRTKDSLKPETAAELSKMMSQYDDLTGRFQSGARINETLEVKLYFDIGAAYFCDKIVHAKLAALTAEEMTAIILHEVGHILTLFSYFKYTVHSIACMSGAFEHFNQYADVQEKIKFMRTKPYKRLLNIDKATTSDPKDTEQLETLMDDLVDRSPDVSRSDSRISKTVLSMMGRVFMIFLLWYGSFYTTVAFLIHLLSFRVARINDGSDRTSDLKGLTRQQYSAEQLADEYVVSHNMGSYLQGGLHKITKLVQYQAGTGYDSHDAGGKTSFLNFHITNFVGVSHWLCSQAFMESWMVHEPTAKRIQTISRQQIDMVRASSTSPQLQRLAIAEYERTYQMAAKQGFMVWRTDAKRRGIQLMVILLNIVPMLLARTTLDYHTEKNVSVLLEKAEKLINNDVAMTAVKVKLKY